MWKCIRHIHVLTDIDVGLKGTCYVLAWNGRNISMIAQTNQMGPAKISSSRATTPLRRKV